MCVSACVCSVPQWGSRCEVIVLEIWISTTQVFYLCTVLLTKEMSMQAVFFHDLLTVSCQGLVRELLSNCDASWRLRWPTWRPTMNTDCSWAASPSTTWRPSPPSSCPSTRSSWRTAWTPWCSDHRLEHIHVINTHTLTSSWWLGKVISCQPNIYFNKMLDYFHCQDTDTVLEIKLIFPVKSCICTQRASWNHSFWPSK